MFDNLSLKGQVEIMTIRKNKNLLCLILAIAMIFSGMCSNSIKADSVLECLNLNNVTSTLDSSDDTSVPPEFRYEEISGARIVSNAIKSDRRSEEKTNHRTDSYLANSEILQQNFTSFFDYVACEISFDFHSATIIINYIHQKDGKK